MFFGKKIASIEFKVSLSPDFFMTEDFKGSALVVAQKLKDIGSSLLAINNCFSHRYIFASGYISGTIEPSEKPRTKVNWLVEMELNRDDVIRFDQAIESSNKCDKKKLFVFHAHFDSGDVINIYHDENGFYVKDIHQKDKVVQRIEQILKSKL